MRLGVDEVDVTELMGGTEPGRLATAAAGLCLGALDAERARSSRHRRGAS